MGKGKINKTKPWWGGQAERPGSRQFPGEYPRAEGTGRERSRATQQGPTCSLQSLQHIQGSRKSSGSAQEVIVQRRCFKPAEPAQGAGRGSATISTHFPSQFPVLLLAFSLAVPAAAAPQFGQGTALAAPAQLQEAQGQLPGIWEVPWDRSCRERGHGEQPQTSGSVCATARASTAGAAPEPRCPGWSSPRLSTVHRRLLGDPGWTKGAPVVPPA